MLGCLSPGLDEGYSLDGPGCLGYGATWWPAVMGLWNRLFTGGGYGDGGIAVRVDGEAWSWWGVVGAG